jgi:hypothetical protein
LDTNLQGDANRDLAGFQLTGPGLVAAAVKQDLLVMLFSFFLICVNIVSFPLLPMVAYRNLNKYAAAINFSEEQIGWSVHSIFPSN